MEEGCVVSFYCTSEDLKDTETVSALSETESSHHQKQRQFYSHLFFLFLSCSFSFLSHSGPDDHLHVNRFVLYDWT